MKPLRSTDDKRSVERSQVKKVKLCVFTRYLLGVEDYIQPCGEPGVAPLNQPESGRI